MEKAEIYKIKGEGMVFGGTEMAYLWGGMLLIGIVYGVLSGNVDEVTKAFVSCSGEAVSLCISMADHSDVDRDDENCGGFRAGCGAGGQDETTDKVFVSETGHRIESGALHMSKFSFKCAWIVMGEYKFGSVRDEGVERASVAEGKYSSRNGT